MSCMRSDGKHWMLVMQYNRLVVAGRLQLLLMVVYLLSYYIAVDDDNCSRRWQDWEWLQRMLQICIMEKKGMSVSAVITIIKHTQPLNGPLSFWAGTRRNIHPLTHFLIIRHPLSTSSTMIHSILVQFTCLTVLFYNLFPGRRHHKQIYRAPTLWNEFVALAQDDQMVKADW